MERVTLGYLLRTALESVPVPIFDGDVTTFGRDEHSTVVLDDLAASRKHATIEGYQGGIFIKDLGSSNGTFVNDNPITPNEAMQLLSGNEIRIGGKVFYLISATPAADTQKKVKARAEEFSRKQTIRPGNNLKADEAAWKNAKQQKQYAPSPRPGPSRDSALITQKIRGHLPVAPGADPSGKAKSAQPAPRVSFTHALSGKIDRGGLPQIIQMIHSKGLSGSMLVTGENLAATILFLDGELYSASNAHERGAAVIYECALAKHTEFSFDGLDNTKITMLPKNIATGTMLILMECCNLMYEASKQE